MRCSLAIRQLTDEQLIGADNGIRSTGAVGMASGRLSEQGS